MGRRGFLRSAYDVVAMLYREHPEPDAQTALEERPGSVRPRVLLADDHHSWLDRITNLLKLEFDLIGTVNDGESLVSAAQRLQPDLIVLDITMPRRNGIEAAHDIHESGPDIKLVFVTVHEEPEYLRACFAEGGLGYVKKSRLGTDLVPAMHEALLGRTFISPSLAY